MQANWSLILNILLLVGVMIAIVRTLKARRRSAPIMTKSPSIGMPDKIQDDDIIAIRKVSCKEVPVREQSTIRVQKPTLTTRPITLSSPSEAKRAAPALASAVSDTSSGTIMMFLLAKAERQFAGYELLQTLLGAGLRFGEGQLFHRHQSPNGQGPVLCSLATATPAGTFDLQNIGAFSVRGLCLFMEASGNPTIDAERFEIMLDTAKQLSEGLDTHLLDDKRQPLTDVSIARYHRILKLEEMHEME